MNILTSLFLIFISKCFQDYQENQDAKNINSQLKNKINNKCKKHNSRIINNKLIINFNNLLNNHKLANNMLNNKFHNNKLVNNKHNLLNKIHNKEDSQPYPKCQ